MTIPLLIQRLQESTCVKEAFRSYRGADWKQHVTYLYGAKCCFPTLIWKNSKMELVVMGWQNQQEYRCYTNHHTVYTHVLEGELSSSIQPLHKHSQATLLSAGMFCSIPPLSIWHVHSVNSAASLHLFHTVDGN